MREISGFTLSTALVSLAILITSLVPSRLASALSTDIEFDRNYRASRALRHTLSMVEGTTHGDVP